MSMDVVGRRSGFERFTDDAKSFVVALLGWAMNVAVFGQMFGAWDTGQPAWLLIVLGFAFTTRE